MILQLAAPCVHESMAALSFLQVDGVCKIVAYAWRQQYSGLGAAAQVAMTAVGPSHGF